jgi:hypothetical protein
MAEVLAFDTLTTLDELRTAGFSDTQARALTSGLRNAVAIRQGELATKADIAELRTEIAELRAELKAAIAELCAELKGDMAELESRLLKAMNDQQRWTIGFTGVMLTLLFAAIRLL